MKNSKNIQNKTIEERYQKKTQHEHILLRPDTYMDSIKNDIIKIYVYNDELNKIVSSQLISSPSQSLKSWVKHLSSHYLPTRVWQLGQLSFRGSSILDFSSFVSVLFLRVVTAGKTCS